MRGSDVRLFLRADTHLHPWVALVALKHSHGYWYLIEIIGLVAHPLLPVFPRGAVYGISRHPDSRHPYHDRNYHQSAQYLHHCLQMVDTVERKIYSLLDGDCDHPCDYIYRGLGIQMDCNPDAGFTRITRMGMEEKT